MKKCRILIWCITIPILFACKKDSSNTNLPVQNNNGVIRPTGESTGVMVGKNIGPSGGVVISEDGNVRIDIPEGAVDSEIIIGIEPITRTLLDAPENASGKAYRITPHEHIFKKSVRITFRFLADELSDFNPSTSAIAYQDAKGKWKGLGKLTIDEDAKTVSVETNHFSDWTTYETIYLNPKDDFSLEVEESANLQVMSVTPLSLLQTGEYVNKEEYFLEEPSPIGLPTDWRIVNGPGNGTIAGVPTISTGIFKAPSSVPGPNNPALVEAKINLKLQGTVLLMRNITIVDKIQPGIHLKIDGGNWIHFPNEQFSIGTSIRDNGEFPFDQHEVALTINGGQAIGEGTWAWTNPVENEKPTSFEYIVKKPGPYTKYEPFYFAPCPNTDVFVSPGYVRITKFKKDQFDNTWVTGEFFISRSEPFIENAPCKNTPHRIQGYFRLQLP